VATLENKALAAAAARTRFDVRTLLAISFAQSAVLLAIAVVTGLWASRKLGLETPLIAAYLSHRAVPEKTRSTLLIAIALGVATGLTLMILDHWLFAPIPSVAKFIRSAESGSAKPAAWQGLLASFYGALDEEILMRLGVMSLLALAFRTLARMRGPRPVRFRPLMINRAWDSGHPGDVRGLPDRAIEPLDSRKSLEVRLPNFNVAKIAGSLCKVAHRRRD